MPSSSWRPGGGEEGGQCYGLEKGQLNGWVDNNRSVLKLNLNMSKNKLNK